MKRAGSKLNLSGLEVRISNVGSIARDKEGHEHILSMSFGGCFLHVSPKELQEILDWYNTEDDEAKDRKTDEKS